jgi:hypothetical protein
VAIPAVDEDHDAKVVKICVFVSCKVAVAVNCWVVPLAILALNGDKAIDVSGDDVNEADPAWPS